MALQKGTYRARATGACVLGTSANKGTPYLELYLEVVKGDEIGKSAKWTGYFTEKTIKRTIEALGFMGWKGDDLSEFVDGALHGLDANEVEIVVEVEEYEYTAESGETEFRNSSKVQWVNRAGGYLNTENAMSANDAKAFGARMRGLVLKVGKEKAAPSDDPTDFPFGANVPEATPKKKSF